MEIKLEAVEFAKRVEKSWREPEFERKTVIVWGKIYRIAASAGSPGDADRFLVSFANNEFDPDAERGYRTIEFLIAPRVFIGEHLARLLQPGQVAAFEGTVKNNDLASNVLLISPQNENAPH